MRNAVETLRHPGIADPSALSRIADRLRAELGAESVIVYGSVARGEARPDSDVDLLVIAPSTDGGFRRIDRACAAIRNLGVGPTVSPIVLTPDEVRARLEADDRFIRQIIETGVEVSQSSGQDARSRWGGIRPMPGVQASDSWRQFARRDWQRMHLLLSADDGAGAAMFLQQAIEKLLKGWLLDQGWEIEKMHQLEKLLDAARAHDPALVSFRPLCERVSKYYLANRYPDGPESPDTEHVRLDAGEARLLAQALFPDEQLS